jgi:hypothetical protein
MLLTANQRRALALLASHRGGYPRQQFEEQFRADLVNDLIREGYAVVQGERLYHGMRVVDVPRIKITAAGRTALRDPDKGKNPGAGK